MKAYEGTGQLNSAATLPPLVPIGCGRRGEEKLHDRPARSHMWNWLMVCAEND
jgi:hypothetical protein